MASAYRFGKKPEDVEVRFRRDLGLLEITMIGLGPTIGTTIFLLVGPGLALVGAALILVFLLNFGVTLFTAMAYIELGSAFPETGGGYLWVKTAMKGPYGFIGGGVSRVSAFPRAAASSLGGWGVSRWFSHTTRGTLGGRGPP